MIDTQLLRDLAFSIETGYAQAHPDAVQLLRDAADELDRLRTPLIATLEAALRPFAEKGRESTGLVLHGCWAPLGITVAEWRAAAAAMEGRI